MEVTINPTIPPIIILKFAIFVMIRNKAPRIQHKADVSPILPGTNPRKRLDKLKPAPARAVVIFSPSGARIDSAVAPLTPSTEFFTATQTSPDMETG